jgi:cytochrome c
MKLAVVAVAAVVLGIGSSHAEDATALLQKYRCYICHADNDPGAGPAYADVATRYRGNPKATATLVAIIKKGAHGGGPWHMPPHPEVSSADAATMARYILSVKQ